MVAHDRTSTSTGKRLGRAVAGPTPSRVHHGSKKTIEVQGRAREASYCSRRGPLFNRAVDGCAKRTQHDCDRRHIRVGAVVLVCSQAMALTLQWRHHLGGNHDYELHTADFCDGGHTGSIRLRCGSQQRIGIAGCQDQSGRWQSC
jgi:hypothetical protein